jgi:glycosyltransferase involved in cell wall biosynthesis
MILLNNNLTLMAKKVLIISNFHENLSISRSNMAFNYFLKKGYDPIVLCSNFSHSLKKFRELDNERFIALSTIAYSSSLSINRIVSYFIFSYKVFKFLGENSFDIVYVNLPPNSIGLSVLLRKSRYSKLIVDIIDLWPEAFPNNNNLIKKTLLSISGIIPKMIRKRTIDYCDFCITESEFFHKELNLKNKRNSKVIYIKKFQTVLPVFENLSKEISIIYLGNIGKIYDFESLFKIIKGIEKKRKVKLHILGLGPLSDWLINNLKSQKIRYEYHGASFDETLKKEIISKCWFGYNGYKHNTEVALSYKSVDYLSYGVPLLNSAKEDTIRLVENEKVGYNFHSGSLESLIDKLSKICIDEVVEMKRNSFVTFQNKFSGLSYYQDMDCVLSNINN